MSEITTKEGENINMSEDKEEGRFSRSTSKSNSEIPMHDYFERICEERSQRVGVRLKSIEEMLKLRFEMQDKATLLANKNLEIRLDKLNELRAEVIQDRSRFVTIDKYDTQHEALESRITKLEMWQSKMYGIAIGIAIVAGVSGGLITEAFK